ncbi:hypothetical protein FKP32DRAFT_1585270 [Trametes sanguinea]|nr:hypothetical protein FKP32DRAFT_1585270 [Trametes sanguinea]
MSAWIADVRRAAFQLTEIGASLTDEDVILVLTSGLPPSYENCVVTLDATPAESLTLDYVVARLLNEESRQAPSAAPPSSRAGDHVLVAAAAAAAAARPRVPISMITCYRCAQKGHYQTNCPLTQPAAVVPTPTAAAAFANPAEEEYTF